jgi:hypothetical protein
MFIVICSKNYFERLKFVRIASSVRGAVSRSIMLSADGNRGNSVNRAGTGTKTDMPVLGTYSGHT